MSQDDNDSLQDKTRRAPFSGNDLTAPPYLSGSDADGKLKAGDCIGEYEIISLLGIGGMGYVYQVRHRILQKVYALKTLNPDRVTENSWQRLQLEGQAIARMTHPNVIAIHNLGLHEGILPFYVMDLLVGENLADILGSNGAIALEEALPILIGVCSGLGYAHKKGIIHRDIKPGNIFLLHVADSSGARVKLVDFGIAKLSGVDASKQNLTTAGEIFGSPYYMSPEQCEGKRVDGRSDIYSLGCTFFEILTGAPPFRGANPIQTMIMHQSQKAPGLSQATGGKYFPEEMEDLIATMLAKAPMDRFQNLDQVINQLEEVQRSKRFDSQGERVNSSSYGTAVRGRIGDEKKDSDEHGKNQVTRFLKICLASILFFSVTGTIAYILVQSFGSKFGSESGSEPRSETRTETTQNVSTTASAIDRYLAGEEEVAGIKYKVFNFPTDRSFGTLKCLKHDDVSHEAIGRQRIRSDSELILVCNPSLAMNPQLLDGFGPGDLHTVYCYDVSKNDSSLFKHISRLTGLMGLEIEGGDVDDQCLPYINQLEKLKGLHLTRTNISGASVGKLQRIQQFKQITFSSGLNTSALLQALKNSSKLVELIVKDVPLTLADCKSISTMAKLRQLTLSGTGLNNADMIELAKLQDLMIFEARDCDVDIHCLSSCKKMKALTELRLGGRNWHAEDNVTFSSALHPVFVD